MTISDIAKLAGVSVATVSRVLNNQGYVKEETRQKIENLIQENGYRPNAVARSLTRSNTSMIAVDHVQQAQSVFRQCPGCHRIRAEQQGYSILFYNTSEDRDKECKAIAQAIEHRVMGSCFCPFWIRTSGRRSCLQERRIRGYRWCSLTGIYIIVIWISYSLIIRR